MLSKHSLLMDFRQELADRAHNVDKDCTFFASLSRRIKELSDQEEDVDKKMAMRKIFRTLQGVNDEVR